MLRNPLKDLKMMMMMMMIMMMTTTTMDSEEIKKIVAAQFWLEKVEIRWNLCVGVHVPCS